MEAIPLCLFLNKPHLLGQTQHPNSPQVNIAPPPP